MRGCTLRPVYSQTAARNSAIPVRWHSRATTRIAFPGMDMENMNRPAQSDCATQPAIQNRKKRAGRPRSRRKERTSRMAKEMASKKVIARSPWFGIADRNLPAQGHQVKNPGRYSRTWTAGRRPLTNLARPYILRQLGLGEDVSCLIIRRPEVVLDQSKNPYCRR
jgi:hypothetical protein